MSSVNFTCHKGVYKLFKNKQFLTETCNFLLGNFILLSKTNCIKKFKSVVLVNITSVVQ